MLVVYHLTFLKGFSSQNTWGRKSLSLRFPESLDEFLEEEMAKTGMTKTSLIREAVRLMKQSKK